MAAVIGILFMICCAVLGGGAAINFFWETGFLRACKIASFFVAIFIIFAMSGMWDGASRHSWGYLTPLFFLLLAAGWAATLAAQWFWKWFKEWRKRNEL